MDNHVIEKTKYYKKINKEYLADIDNSINELKRIKKKITFKGLKPSEYDPVDADYIFEAFVHLKSGNYYQALDCFAEAFFQKPELRLKYRHQIIEARIGHLEELKKQDLVLGAISGPIDNIKSILPKIKIRQEKENEQKPRLPKDNQWVSNALVEFNNGYYEKAIELLSAVTEENPYHYDAFLLLGEVCAEIEDYKNAYKCFKRAFTLDPTSQMAKNNMLFSKRFLKTSK